MNPCLPMATARDNLSLCFVEVEPRIGLQSFWGWVSR